MGSRHPSKTQSVLKARACRALAYQRGGGIKPSATAFAASSLPGDSLDNFFALNSNFTGRANGGIASAYNAYNVATQNIFALNGTDRKRIVGSDVFEWGIDPPAAAP